MIPEPKKIPKPSYIRFEAAMPNETWQSDFTHYPLTDTVTFPKGVEIITWLDEGHLPRSPRSARHPRIHPHRQRCQRRPKIDPFPTVEN